MTAPTTRWALSPSDFRAHAVTADETPDDSGAVMVARCGHKMPREAGLDDGPRAQACAQCVIAIAPNFEARGELVNAAREAEGITEWFPDDPHKPMGEDGPAAVPEDRGGWGGPPDGR